MNDPHIDSQAEAGTGNLRKVLSVVHGETFMWVLRRGMEMEWKSSFQKEPPAGRECGKHGEQ